MDIKVTMNPVYIPYLNKEQFLQIFFGGSSSGKSYFLTDKIVIDNLNGVNWLCCRNVAKTIRNSIFNEITKSISNMGLRKYYSINKSDMVITCKLNDKQIMFCGLDDVEKVKSITPQNGVLERIFIEEATEIKREAYMQLKKRLRGKSDKSKHIYMAFNPILKTHWIYQEFFGMWEDDKNKYEDNNVTILKTTYKDNLFLTKEDRDLLENETDPYFYNVYTLGNWGILGNVIFKNWRVENLSDRKSQFDRIHNGCDFGWTDPTAMIKIHLDKNRKKIYVFNEVYKQYLTDAMIIAEAKAITNGYEYITCDSADPRMINKLANNGVRAKATDKSHTTIVSDIHWLWDYEIIVDVSCQNFKNEIEQYHWKEDKYGNVIEDPVDKNNHLLDALRYALNDEILASEVKAGIRI